MLAAEGSFAQAKIEDQRKQVRSAEVARRAPKILRRCRRSLKRVTILSTIRLSAVLPRRLASESQIDRIVL